jgi:two-component system sensor histidine kinase RpfC
MMLGNLKKIFFGLRSKPQKESDIELDQAGVRIKMVLVITGVLLYNDPPQNLSFAEWQIFLFMGAVLTLAGFIYRTVKRKPGYFPARRIAVSFVDNAAVTLIILQTHAALAFFPIFLWITLGNGFRYGMKYLFISQAFSLTGLFVLMTYSPKWSHAELAPAFIATLIFIPLYATSLIKRLSNAVERAQEASEAKTQFVSNISHEIRTPLNGITGISEILTLGRYTKEEYIKLCSSLTSSAHSLMRLLNDVLDMAKIESGKVDIIKSDFDLHSLIKDTVKMFDYQALNKNIELKINISPKVPRYCFGAPKQVQQILTNLIGNAVKFTEQGWVAVKVTPIKSENKTTVLRFEITDTGIGIPEAHLDTVFERFAQVNKEHSVKNVGTGLGTTIAKQLVEAMGGVIGVSSQQGVGSTFWFELPIEAGDKQKAVNTTRHSLAAEIDANRELRKELKILIAEDNKTNQMIITSILDQAGYAYTLKEDGEDALDALLDEQFDIAILDMLMPSMSGIEVCKAYKDCRTSDNHLEFVMLSANVQQSDIDMALNIGFNSCLPKPVEFAKLLRLLDERSVRKVTTGKNGELLLPELKQLVTL